MRGKHLSSMLGILLLTLACTVAFAQNPITNPGFENGFTGWTTYTYGSGQTSPATPQVGKVGAGETFSVLFPNQGAAEGVNVCGHQGWYDAKAGGVYQTFTATAPGYIVIAARAFSVIIDPAYEEKDMGPRVRAAVVTGAQTSRTVVPFTGPSAWKSCTWGANWNDIIIQVPAAGTYTLFIENMVTWDNCIYSTLWDNVRWAEGTITMTNQPYVSQITETTAKVCWDTDIAGTSVVSYDQNGPPYDNTVSGTSGTHHEVILTGLTPGTTYHFSAQTDAPPFPSAGSNDLKFTTAPTPVAQLTNGDFETGNLAPWAKFGEFDGVLPNNHQAAPAHSGAYMAGATASYDNVKSLSGCMQRINVKPGASYVVRAWVWTETNMAYPPTAGNTGEAWNTQARVGIDPRGGVDLWQVDPASGQPTWNEPSRQFVDNPNITWSDWQSTQHWEAPFPQLGYTEIGTIVQIPADSNVATVFLQCKHLWALGMMRTVFDDIVFVEEIAVDNLGKAKLAPANWTVDLSNGGQGYMVTRFEFMTSQGSMVPYVWIQEDDRSSAMKVNMGTLSGASTLFPGDRITLKGRTKKYNLIGTEWGETEIAASEFTPISSGNAEHAPVALSNKSVAGAEMGTMRGATGGIGANNVGLLVKTTGRVVSVDPNYAPGTYGRYFIKIDDGSGVNVTVYHPEDFMYYADMPAVGQMISASGVCGLKINDPTPGDFGIPNGSGDETLLPTVMLRDGRDIQVIPE